MFDGAGVATLSTVATEPLAQSQAEALSSPEDVTAGDALPDAAPTGEPQFSSADQALFDALAAYDTSAARQEIVFLSPSVRDYQQLLDGISPNVEVIILDPARDGVQQMAEVLAGRTGIDAIHLIGEGTEAEMHLGASFLTQESISTRYAEQFQQISQSLSQNADLLIYGCNFGRGDAGQAAIQTLATLTGADVAASTDRTGHVSEFANWNLEVWTGSIESSVVIGTATQEAWEGVLATFTVTNTNDSGAGSLRQAMTDANATPGTDTIIIPTGTYVLTTGKLIINDNVIITGAGAATTLIDGNANERVFETRGSSITTMSGVTIQNGRQNGNGAGVFVDNSSILNLSDAILTNNNGTGGDGGAFHVHGTLNLNRVLINNNLANNGAGIYFHGANGGSLTNVTISGNTATNQGGGIWTDMVITVTNSTFTLNNANDGGGIYSNGATVTMSNTIVSGNTAATVNKDVRGSFSSNGFNLIEVVGTATGFGSDITGVSANLDVLADNGGPTRTHALLAGSPALNAGTTTGAPAVDQRGFTRDAAPDIGAYEYKSSAFVSKNEFTVNSPSGDNEQTSGPVRGAERAVDIAPNGDYVVVWTNSTTNDKVFAKVLDASGNQKVAQFQVNIGGGNNTWADVSMDDSGNFLVTWNQGSDIFMRRFLANGTAVDAGDVIVNTGTSNTQQNSSVNMNGAGDFVIAWEGDGGANEGIFVRRGSMGGGLIGSDITVNTAAAAKDPSVGIADSGDFVVVWDNGSDVFFQLYNSAGVPQTGSQVDIVLQASAGGAAVDMSGDGRFTVAYRATVLNVDVYVRQYDAAGNPLFLPRLANTSILGTQTSPSITMDDIGEFIVVWEGSGNQLGQNDTAGVFGQKFNASGQKIGFEFLINQTTANTQDRASVAMLDRDNFVAVWTGSDGTQTDIFARQYGATTSPTLDLDADNSSGVTGNDYAFTFTEGDGPTVIADSDTNLADVDSTTFAYVTLSVSGLLDGNAEVLILDGDTFALAIDAPGQDTSGGNYHVRVSTATGTAIMTITKQSGGTFSEVEAETLIKAIRYQHTDTSNPTDGDRLIEVRVNDGTTDSAAARTTINVNPVNMPPTATVDSYTIDEDTTLTTEPAWFDQAWLSRQKLTFNNTAQVENLVDFPVLITLNAGNIDYTKVQNAGEDLRFVDTDGTQLAYEIESWNEVGTSYVWVKVPQIDGTSGTDYIWMYYENAGATDNQNAAGVWSNNFEALSHLHNDFLDSTGNAHNGINNGSLDITGTIGDGQSFDGVDDRIDISSGAGIDNIFAGGATVSAWINPSGWGEGGFGRILDKGNATAVTNGWALQVENTGNRLIFELGFSGNTGRWRSSINSISLGSWQHVTVAYDSSSAANDPTIYVNGVALGLTESSTPSGVANSDVGLNLAIGNRSGSTDRTFQGILDEVRLETGTRSVDWVKAQYLSMTDAFVTFAAAEGPGGVLANDTDADGDLLTAIQVSANPANAQSFTLNPDGSFSYTPVMNFAGIDTFTYKVNDGTVDGNTVVVTINVNPVNDAPLVATNTGTTVSEASIGNVLTTAMLNEGDPDDAGTGLTYTVTAVTTNGTVRLSGTALGLNDTFTQDDIDTNRVTYDHNGSETTTDTFSFSLADGGENGATPATGVFTINITPANDPPVFTGLDNTPTFTEGGPAVVLDNNATIADTELDAANNYNGATLTLVRNGGANADDVFANTGTLNALTESGSLVVGGTTIGTVTTNSGGTLVLTFNGNATTARVNSALQQLTYANSNGTPPANVQIDFTFNDGNAGAQGSGGALNGTGSITVTITPTNTAPTVDLDANNSSGAMGNDYAVTFAEGSGPIGIADSDTDLVDADSVTFAHVQLAVSGLLDGNSETLVLDGSTFALATAVAGQDTTGGNYRVVIATGAGTATLTITKQGGGTFTEGETETLIEAIQYHHTDTSAPTDGNRLLDVIVNDGTADSAAARTTINVNPVNDPPVITSNGGGPTANVTVPENVTFVTTVTSSDVDGGTAVYSIVPVGTGGGADAARFTIDSSTGVLSFVAAPDYEAPTDVGADNVYDVTVQVSDGNGGTTIQALSIMVTDVAEGLPPTTPPPPIPPSLVPQPPAPPLVEPSPAGSPPLPPVVVPAPVSPKPNSEVPLVPVPPGNDPDGTALLSSEMSGAPHPKGMNTPVPSIQLMREMRGYVEEGVAPRMYQTDKQVPRAFDGQTLEKAPTGLSEAFRTSLGVVEEDLRRAADMSESSLKFAVGVTNLGGVSLTAGVIAWLLRSGALLASLAATLPAWRHFDPLPVVLTSDRTRRRSTADTVVAADRENKQFRGLRDLLDRKGHNGRSEGEGGEG
jgi:hypothetical protein